MSINLLPIIPPSDSYDIRTAIVGNRSLTPARRLFLITLIVDLTERYDDDSTSYRT